MIVIDEQLQGEGLEESIGRWYQGSIVSVISLRPNTVIKDEAIPGLLTQLNQPIFLTINATDFWQRSTLSDKFCIVCFVLTSSEIEQIPDLLRRLLRHADFNSKAKRAGKAVRVTLHSGASFYSELNNIVRPIVGF